MILKSAKMKKWPIFYLIVIAERVIIAGDSFRNESVQAVLFLCFGVVLLTKLDQEVRIELGNR